MSARKPPAKRPRPTDAVPAPRGIGVILEDIQSTQKLMFEKISSIDDRLDRLDGRADGLEGRMDRFETRMDRFEHRIDTVEFHQKLTLDMVRGLGDDMKVVKAGLAGHETRLARLENARDCA